MEYQNQQGLYQTGYTPPQKSYRGIIAFLLIVIVILGSVATVSGLLNIQLFRALSMQSEEPASVAFVELANTDSRSAGASANALGISVKTLSVFDQKFYHLPQGVYITYVIPGSSAASHGIVAGDILISVESTPTTDVTALEEYLSHCAPKQPLKVVIFRDGKLHTLTLTMGGNQ